MGSGRGRMLALALVLALASGCALVRRSGPPSPEEGEARFAAKPLPVFTVPLAADGRTPAETLIGRPRWYEVREGETLLDVARWFDLGYNEIIEANPGVDPWLPPPGKRVIVPTAWVLPCCSYEGLVLNIPEMRLYLYQRDAASPGALVVRTYPVGIGRTDRRTPRGRFRIKGKTVNPRWDIPESIRQEHIRERGDRRRFIAGGDPENPLGKYRFELSLPRYAIHGTNVPWGAGMPVSHGCARLYPEDIEQMFPLVDVGTAVEITYQPVKAGVGRGEVWVEAHPDLYGMVASLHHAAIAALRQRGLPAVGSERLRTAVDDSRGMPIRVGVQRTTGATPRRADVTARVAR